MHVHFHDRTRHGGRIQGRILLVFPSSIGEFGCRGRVGQLRQRLGVRGKFTKNLVKCVSVHGKDVGKFLQVVFREKGLQFFAKYTRERLK